MHQSYIKVTPNKVHFIVFCPKFILRCRKERCELLEKSYLCTVINNTTLDTPEKLLAIFATFGARYSPLQRPIITACRPQFSTTNPPTFGKRHLPKFSGLVCWVVWVEKINWVTPRSIILSIQHYITNEVESEFQEKKVSYLILHHDLC